LAQEVAWRLGGPLAQGGEVIGRGLRRRIGHRPTERAVALVHERFEGRLHVIHASAKRARERLGVGCTPRVRRQHRTQALVAADRDQVLDKQRGLKVREREALGVFERVGQLPDAKRLALAKCRGKRQRVFAAPGRLAAVLLKD
jgi:hypothetical protein